jgi:23S rRNA (uracil1939-C5)-methyltransferase
MKKVKPRQHRRFAAKKNLPPEIRTLRVEDLSRAGAGVAKDEAGRVIFIPYTAPGDVVKVKLLTQKSKFAHAQLLEILQPAALRQTPPCPVFGRCGGCDWQHLPYSLQWQTKVQGVEEALKRFKVPVATSLHEYPATSIWSYRNRIQLRGSKKDLGFYAKASHTLVPVSRCAIVRPELNEHFEAIRRQGELLGKPYKVELEVLPDGEVRSDWNAATAAHGFEQINSEQNHNLKQWVLDNMSRNQPVLDLYGSSANLSAQLAAYSPRIDCVDLTIPLNPAAVFPENIFFHEGDVYSWIVKKAQQTAVQKNPAAQETYSAIIDPPRGGMPQQLGEFIQCLLRINVSELIAVGCKTDTWARDLKEFIQQGWNVEKVAVFDFFPQTAHVETAAMLTHA